MQSLFGGGRKRHFNPFDYEKLNPKLLCNSGLILFVLVCDCLKKRYNEHIVSIVSKVVGKSLKSKA